MRILVFDSGLGGLSVFKHVTGMLPEAEIVYAADNAGFPYGRWSEDKLSDRITGVMGDLVRETQPDIGVIACNTASTIVLKRLRNSYPLPFVGTVPAIKVAAATSRSRCFSVLATPGTAARVYTRELVERFAPDCRVKLVGVRGLAGLAEAKLRGVDIVGEHVVQLIAPAFVHEAEQRTDTVVLACTHYPLLKDELEAAAPWPVRFIDPGPAIAQQVGRVARALEKDKVKGEASLTQRPRIIFTADIGHGKALRTVLKGYGFALPEQILPGWGCDRTHDGISG
jgi:glutamate racemase